MTHALLALLLAVGPDGGTPDVLSVRAARLIEDRQDGGTEITDVEGGCWLSTQKCISTAKELVDRRVETKELEATAWRPPYVWMAAALAVGFVIGVPLGYLGAKK